MHRKWIVTAAIALALQAGSAAAANAEGTGYDATTKYRVYQSDNSLREFAAESDAIAYATRFQFSHVERIAGRSWVWDNLPRYKVYENGFSTVNREFRSLAEAKQFAAKLRFAQIRDLEQPGWIYATYPRYRLYQGDRTLPGWSFASLEDAKKTAKAYSNVHIIELSSNQWVWDNLSDAQKEAQRNQTPVYDITVNGRSAGSQLYSFLLDAIRASAKVPGSTVVNTATGSSVFENAPFFTVEQFGKPVGSYYGIEGALVYAKKLAGASIVNDGLEWWTNTPYLTVLQNNKPVASFNTRAPAVAFAAKYAGSAVVTADGRAIWSNKKKLLYLGWNGVSDTRTVLSQVGQTQGLDYDSPSWFELAAADGTISDSSDPALAASLNESGMKLMPLVDNQFDSKLTSAFLRNPDAQSSFIESLVARSAELGVDGINLDFEMMAGGDRDLFTAFVRNLTEAAHQKGLKVTIDLPRGDVNWDRYTAYDHRALADIVDMIMIMAYDQHWSGSDEAGSVGELSWVEDGVQQFLAYGIPRGKLMLGIPFYTREWRIDSAGRLVDSRAVVMKDLPGIISGQHAQGSFDAAAGQMKYSYQQDGYTRIIWAETPDTVKARIAIAKKYDLAGVAIWRLGYESPDLWTMMLQQK